MREVMPPPPAASRRMFTGPPNFSSLSKASIRQHQVVHPSSDCRRGGNRACALKLSSKHLLAQHRRCLPGIHGWRRAAPQLLTRNSRLAEEVRLSREARIIQDTAGAADPRRVRVAIACQAVMRVVVPAAVLFLVGFHLQTNEA